jgi:hypothetical protein
MPDLLRYAPGPVEDPPIYLRMEADEQLGISRQLRAIADNARRS